MDCPPSLYNILIASGIGLAFLVSCGTNVALCCRRNVYECPYCEGRMGKRHAIEHLTTCPRRLAHVRNRRAAVVAAQLNPMDAQKLTTVQAL